MGAIDLGVFVIPVWYIIAVTLATGGYCIAFRNHDRVD
jgi:hypothetical protein